MLDKNNIKWAGSGNSSDNDDQEPMLIRVPELFSSSLDEKIKRAKIKAEQTAKNKPRSKNRANEDLER